MPATGSSTLAPAHRVGQAGRVGLLGAKARPAQRSAARLQLTWGPAGCTLSVEFVTFFRSFEVHMSLAIVCQYTFDYERNYTPGIDVHAGQWTARCWTPDYATPVAEKSSACTAAAI